MKGLLAGLMAIAFAATTAGSARGEYLVAVTTLHGVDQGSYTPMAHTQDRAQCMILRKQMLDHPILGIQPPYALMWTCMTDAQWMALHPVPRR
jgi:hypothetical protein